MVGFGSVRSVRSERVLRVSERERESFFFFRERERFGFGFGGFEFWGERERNEGRFEGIERSVMAMEYGPHRDA